MRYILSSNIALRSWKDAPYAYIKKTNRFYHRLTKEAFELMKSCDGICDVPPSMMLFRLLDMDLVRPAGEKERLSDWQKLRIYENIYFSRLDWAITGKCNMNCLHCFMAMDNAPMMDEFTYEQCIDLLDECVKTGIFTVTLSGGEPMLHPDFFDIVKACSDRDIYIIDLITNGSFLTKDTLKKIKELGQNPMIKMSFDGVGHHDWLRGSKGAEAKALDAIKLATDEGFRVMVQTNVHPGNVSCIYDTVMKVRECGSRRIRIIRTSESPRWLENAPEGCLDMDRYYDEMLKLSNRLVSNNLDMVVDIWQFIIIDPINKRFSIYPLKCSPEDYRDERFSCPGTRPKVAVASTGELSYCNQSSGYQLKNGISFGNVKKEKLSDLLKPGPYLDLMNTTFGEIYENNEACRNCKYWKYCAGGCRAIALVWSGDFLGQDKSKCYFFNHGYVPKIVESFKNADKAWKCENDLGDLCDG